MKKLLVFEKLAKLFESNGFSLYLVGGSTRDFLLDKPFFDFDFATDALPSEAKKFLPPFKKCFEAYGSFTINFEGVSCDITTLREEKGYLDHRHPDKVIFIKDPKIDSNRRDFTINAFYLTSSYQILDYHNGLTDLKNKIIRFIGDPYLRIKEDPLRILRAERFKEKLGFSYAIETKKAIDELHDLINELNPYKILEEKKKGELL